MGGGPSKGPQGLRVVNLPPPTPTVHYVPTYISVPATRSAADIELDNQRVREAAAMREQLNQMNRDAEEERRRNAEETRRLAAEHRSELREQEERRERERQQASADQNELLERMEQNSKEFSQELQRLQDQQLKTERRHGQEIRETVDKHHVEFKELTDRHFESERRSSDQILAFQRSHFASMAQAIEIIGSMPRIIEMNREAETIATMIALVREPISEIQSSFLQLNDKVFGRADDTERKAEIATMHNLCVRSGGHCMELLNLLDTSIHIDIDVRRAVRDAVMEAKQNSTDLSSTLRQLRCKELAIDVKDLNMLEKCVQNFETRFLAVAAIPRISPHDQSVAAIRRLQADDSIRMNAIGQNRNLCIES